MRFWSRAAPLIIVLCYSTTAASAPLLRKATEPEARTPVHIPGVEFAARVVNVSPGTTRTVRQNVAETKPSEVLLADKAMGILIVPAGTLTARSPVLGR
jgi:hypothetical protein